MAAIQAFPGGQLKGWQAFADLVIRVHPPQQTPRSTDLFPQAATRDCRALVAVVQPGPLPVVSRPIEIFATAGGGVDGSGRCSGSG